MWQLSGVPIKLPVVDETSLNSEWWGLCIHFLQAIGKWPNFLFWQLFSFSICIVQFSIPTPLMYTLLRKVSFMLTYCMSINSPRRFYITPRLGVSWTRFKLDLLLLPWKTKTLQLGHIILRQPFACWWVLFFLVVSLKQTKPFTHLIQVKQVK